MEIKSQSPAGEPRPKPISAEHSVGHRINSEMSVNLDQKGTRENLLQLLQILPSVFREVLSRRLSCPLTLCVGLRSGSAVDFLPSVWGCPCVQGVGMARRIRDHWIKLTLKLPSMWASGCPYCCKQSDEGFLHSQQNRELGSKSKSEPRRLPSPCLPAVLGCRHGSSTQVVYHLAEGFWHSAIAADLIISHNAKVMVVWVIVYLLV